MKKACLMQKSIEIFCLSMINVKWKITADVCVFAVEVTTTHL